MWAACADACKKSMSAKQALKLAEELVEPLRNVVSAIGESGASVTPELISQLQAVSKLGEILGALQGESVVKDNLCEMKQQMLSRVAALSETSVEAFSTWLGAQFEEDCCLTDSDTFDTHKDSVHLLSSLVEGVQVAGMFVDFFVAAPIADRLRRSSHQFC